VRPVLAIVAAAALAAPGGCARGGHEIPSWSGPSVAHQLQLIREAEAFMANYARLLLAGDRAAIAALYDPDGAILVLNGRRTDADQAEIVRRYSAAQWRPPSSFRWHELHYEAVGPDAVSVLGGFEWGEGGGPPVAGSYHALLRRENGRLFIRIEDEAVRPPAP
jgi:ketosteroid isomerase-like protein